MKKIALTFAGMLLMPLFFFVSVTSAGTPQLQNNLCAGADLKVPVGGADAAGCEASTVEAANSVNNIIATVINIFSLVVGVVAVIMIIIGGLKYITSGGDSGNVTGAKNTILYAVVGLVVVALAQIIVRFVLNQATVATP